MSIPNPNSPEIVKSDTQGGVSEKSVLEKMIGINTNIIVFLLFLFTLIGLILIVCIKENPSQIIVGGLITLLGSLGGYFVGTQGKE